MDPTRNLGSWGTERPPRLKPPSQCRLTWSGEGKVPSRRPGPQPYGAAGAQPQGSGAGSAVGFQGRTPRSGRLLWGRGRLGFRGSPPPRTPEDQVLLPGPPKSGHPGPKERAACWAGRQAVGSAAGLEGDVRAGRGGDGGGTPREWAEDQPQAPQTGNPSVLCFRICEVAVATTSAS